MIRINLLPEEYRRKAKTPVRVLGAVCAGVGVNALIASWYGWLAFGVGAEVASESAVLQTELDGLAPQVSYFRSLDAEKRRFAGREETLAGITTTRVNWTAKIDQLITIVNNGGEGQRHFVWLDDLNIQQSSDPRAKSAGQMRAQGHSGSEHFAQVANFLDDIEDPVFMKEFLPPAPPEGTQAQVDKELEPSVVWNFPLKLEIKSTAPPKPEPKKAPAKPAAAPAEGAQQ
jgi:Tfp pilus assembly protein PilN